MLPVVSNNFYKKSIGGFETLSMIPASIGGAIVMNAGCYGSNISDLIEYVYVLDEKLNFWQNKFQKCKFWKMNY